MTDKNRRLLRSLRTLAGGDNSLINEAISATAQPKEVLFGLFGQKNETIPVASLDNVLAYIIKRRLEAA